MASFSTFTHFKTKLFVISLDGKLVRCLQNIYSLKLLISVRCALLFQMLMLLPAVVRSEYSHLVSNPRFILEQLLMNMRPELAGRLYTDVQAEFGLIHTASLKFTVEQFNKLVSLYAKKALEFTVVQYIDGEHCAEIDEYSSMN